MTEKALLIGIVGGSRSGKTSHAQALIRRLGQAQVETLLLDMDADCAPLEVVCGRFGERPINWDHPHAFYLELMASHLAGLKRSQLICKPVYEFSTNDRVGWSRSVLPGRVVLLEGLLLFALPELRDPMDVKIFVNSDADIRILRRLQRDTLDSVIQQYLQSVRPVHLEFVEPSKRWADLIVPTGLENERALEVLLHHVLGVVNSVA